MFVSIRVGRVVAATMAAFALMFGVAACSKGEDTAPPVESSKAEEVVAEDAAEDEVEEEIVEEEAVPTDGVVAEYGVPFGTDLLTFTILGTSESNTGSPNYKVEITNTTDEQLMIKDGGSTVDGQEVNAYVNTTIKAGDTKTTYFSFSDSAVTSGADLVDVVILLEVQKEGFETVEDLKVYFPNWEE